MSTYPAHNAVAFDVTQDDIDAVRHQPRSVGKCPIEYAMLRYAGVRYVMVECRHVTCYSHGTFLVIEWEPATTEWVLRFDRHSKVVPFVAVGHVRYHMANEWVPE